MISRVDRAPTLQRSAERELVGVLEVAADRQARGDAGDLEAERLKHPRQVHRRDLALSVGVGADDDLLDALGPDARQQLPDLELFGADTLERAHRAEQHVISTMELARALDRHD